MKGDFTRNTFRPREHYSGVLLQQGRVQVDADWNEQQAITRRRAEVAARDIIGRCGAPQGNPGFKIGRSENTLTIGRGRMYVDGILCENDSDDWTYESQPHYPNPPDWLGLLGKRGIEHVLVYLDVWDRHITRLDDPLIHEVALGTPDTATRSQTVWQVKVLPLVRKPGRRVEPGDVRPAARGTLQPDLFGEMRRVIPSELRLARPGPAGILPSDLVVPSKVDLPLPIGTGMLTARAQPSEEVESLCELPAQAGYWGPENQLYRVEIHQGGTLGKATFKWSRDNGIVVTAVAKIGADKHILVKDLGPDGPLGFATGQWVELIDRERDLKLEKPGPLFQISEVKTDSSTIVVLDPASELPVLSEAECRTGGYKLRRWDSAGALPVAIAADNDGWLKLEKGVQVRFSEGTYKTGDYWLIPARTATRDVEWPPYEVPNTSPEPQEPHGILHHYCLLAIVDRQGDEPEDLRCVFPTLCNLPENGGEVPAKGCLCTVTLGVEVQTIGEAVAYLKETTGGAGCICIPSGVWPQKEPVIVDGRHITVMGCGPASVITYLGEGALFRVQAAEDILFRDLQIDAQEASAPAFELAEASHIRILRCILHCQEKEMPAIVVWGGRDITVEECQVTASVGIRLEKSGGLDALQVLHNWFEAADCSIEALSPGPVTQALIEHNSFGRAGVRFGDLSHSGVSLVGNLFGSDGEVAVDVGSMVQTRLDLSGNQIGTFQRKVAVAVSAVTVDRAELVLRANQVFATEMAVRVVELKGGALLQVAENQVSPAEPAAARGIWVEVMKDEARLDVEHNEVISREAAIIVGGEDGTGDVRVSANSLRSLEVYTVVDIAPGKALGHALFSNNQVYSRTVPDLDKRLCTVMLNARRLVVVGNYVVDEGDWGEKPPGASIWIAGDREAVTAIGNVTHSGVLGDPTDWHRVRILNNALW